MKKNLLGKRILLGLMAGVSILPSAALANDYNSTLTGDTKSDIAYAKVIKNSGDKVIYDFTNETSTKIMATMPIGVTDNSVTIDAKGLNLVGSKGGGIELGDNSEVTINADTLSISVDGANQYGLASGISLNKTGSGKGEKSVLIINAPLKMKKDNLVNPWAITGGDLHGGVPGYKGTRWATTGVNLGEGEGSHIDFNQPVDIAVKGIAVKTDPFYKVDGMDDKDLSIINIAKGGNIITPVDKSIGYYALASFGGTINVNVNNIGASDSNKVKIVGNIIAAKEKNNSGGEYFYRNGAINLGIVNKDSSWHGVVDNFGGKDYSGDIKLYLQNGGQWIHEATGKTNGLEPTTMPFPSNENHYFNYDGTSYLTNLIGGQEEVQQGYIFQKDAAKINIANYAGNTKVFYEHENAGTNKVDYKAGDIEIEKATSGSMITLATDNKNVDTSKKEEAAKTLNALASKLTYKAKDNALKGKLEIAEGLTASAAAISTGDIKFNNEGVGGLKDDSVSMKTVEKEEVPVITEFSTTITGGTDKAYQEAGIKQGNKYTFTKDSQINITSKNSNAVAVELRSGKKIDIDAGNNDLSFEVTGKNATTRGILVEGANLNLKGKNLQIKADIKQNFGYTDTIKVMNGSLNIDGHTNIEVINSSPDISAINIAKKGEAKLKGVTFDGGNLGKKTVKAIQIEGGTAEVNINEGKSGENDVNLTGDIYVANASGDENYKSTLNLGLGTANSKLIGVFAYRDKVEEVEDEFGESSSTTYSAGEMNLYLQNGATWKNKQISKSLSDFKGSKLKNFVGGSTRAKAGIILQEDKNDINIEKYAGHGIVNYTHESSDPAKFNAGDFKIKAAEKNSEIILQTSNEGVNEDNAKEVLGKLANKLYYENSKTGESNLVGYVQIAEGLTASSKRAQLGDIKYNTKGQGELKDLLNDLPGDKEVTPTEPPKSEEKPKEETTKPEVDVKPNEPGTDTGSKDIPKDIEDKGKDKPEVVKPFIKDNLKYNDGSIVDSIKLAEDKNIVLDYNTENSSIGNTPGTSPSISGVHNTLDNMSKYHRGNHMVVDLDGHKLDMDIKGTRILNGINIGENVYLDIKDVPGTGKINMAIEDTQDTRAANGINFRGEGHFTSDADININKLITTKTSVSGINAIGTRNEAVFNKDLTMENLGVNQGKGKRDLPITGINTRGINLVGQDNKVEIKGKLTIKDIAGNGIVIVDSGNKVIAKKVDISVAEDNDKAKEYNAIYNTKGDIFINIADEKASELKPDNNEVKIKGDILVLNGKTKSVIEYTGGEKYRELESKGRVFLGLTTDKSYFHGAIKGQSEKTYYEADKQEKGGYDAKEIGEVELWLNNKAVWNNEKLSGLGKAIGKTVVNEPWQGSKVMHLHGGNTPETAGLIMQNTAENLNIENYSGYTIVNYKHDNNTPSNILGGNTIVKKAQTDSFIRLRTDNAGIDTNNQKVVNNVLGALANKLYYEGAIDKKEANLTGISEIVEGLTASSAQANLSSIIKYNETTGQGYVNQEKEEVQPPITDETTKPETGKDTAGNKEPSAGEGTGTGSEAGSGTSSGTESSTDKSSGTVVTPPATGETTSPETGTSGGTAPSTGGSTGIGSEVESGTSSGTVPSTPSTPSIGGISLGAYETQAMKGVRGGHMSGSLMTLRKMSNDLNKRLGDIRFNTGEAGIWAKVDAGKDSFNGNALNSNLKYKNIKVGYDRKIDTKWLMGGEVSYLKGDTDFSNGYGNITNTSIGLYASKVNNDGYYVDIISKWGKIKNSFHINAINKDLVGEDKTNAMIFSLETGKRIVKGDKFIQPEIELTYGYLPESKFLVRAGNSKMVVVADKVNSLVGRIGIALGKVHSKGSVQAKFSVNHEFLGSTKLTYIGENTKVTNYKDLEDTWFTFGLATTQQVSDAMNIYGEATKGFGVKYKANWQVNLGVRWQF